MSDINSVILKGRLARDAESRDLGSSGNKVCRFVLVTSEKYDGGEDTVFHDCEMYGKKADLAKFLTKGRTILIQAKTKQDKWEDKNTKEKRSKIVFLIKDLDFCDTKKGNE